MARSKVVFYGETIMDITPSTVTKEKLLSGEVAFDKKGEKIIGTCTFDSDTKDATAASNEILVGKTAYAVGNKITGTMPNNEGMHSKISTKDQVVNIPIGFHDGSGNVAIADVEKEKLVPANIKAGAIILGVEGEYTGEGVPTQSKTATPSKTQQTILPDEGYNLSQVIVNAIPYEETINEQGGMTVTIG